MGKYHTKVGKICHLGGKMSVVKKLSRIPFLHTPLIMNALPTQGNLFILETENTRKSSDSKPLDAHQVCL